MTESPIVDSGLDVPVFSLGDDPIACLNKAMAFLTAGRQGQSYFGIGYKSNATSSGRNNASGHTRVVRCYNCQGEGYMARQCPQPKQQRNEALYKDKAMLAEAQEVGQILEEEQLAFLADPGVPNGQVVQTIIPNNAAFQTEDLDTYDSDCDDILNAKAVLMANISNYGSDVIAEFLNSNNASTSSSGTLPSNTIANPRSDLKSITTRNGVSYDGPQIPPPPSFLPKVVENEPEATKDIVQPTNNESTEDVQPLVVQSKSLILTSEPVNSPTIEPVTSSFSALRPNQRPSIPYPSRMQDQKLRDKANEQREKFFQIFKDLNFNISFVDALILMPKFGPSIKSLLTNKDKLCELARTPLNEHWSVILLKKLLEKLGDPNKFLIPCDFLEKAECLALSDLGASINLMPLFVWNKLSLPNLTPKCMTLELADRLISRLVGVTKDVYVKVGTFHFSADFVIVDFDVDPQVPLILERSFLKTRRALIDVFKGSSGDFLLEEVDAFLALEDDPTSLEVDQSYLDPERDILLLEAFLNDDPSLPPPNQGNYLPEVRKELKICEAKSDKSSIDEPPEVKLKDLPPHLKYAFLKGDDKFPVIIAKDLSMEEKTALITIQKSRKRAIAWKLSDIKGIDPEFCTHKILMEEDFEPAVQHQRGVNPKIHDVIKQEVLKLLDAGLIYPISDSPWVSPVHCIPKEGGFTIVENKDNELIPTRLVTGWRVYIDYRKLNEATCKDHFPLPFMDQMLERLARNQYYCFFDGFSGYFQIPIDPKDQEKTTFTAHTERLLIVACLLGYAMHRARFRERMLKRCEDTNLCLNWEKSYFMVKEGIVLGHKISKQGIKVDKSKVDVITKLPHPTTMKGIQSFLVMPTFIEECVESFQTLKRKLIEAPILIALDWDMPFELMYDASDFAIDHFALKYLFAKKDSKARLLRWVLLLQEFTFKVIDTKGAENLAVYHLSRLENPHQNMLDPKEINKSFPLETLNLVSTRGNSSTPWFADFANYHAGNFVVKDMSSQQKNLEPPDPLSVIEERTSVMTSLQRSCKSSVSLTV
nr:reverse transcriptase domain-containing protein [Tanacetum cinerariifolium]